MIRKTARASELRQAIAAALQGEGGLPAFDHDGLRAKTEQLSPDLLAVIGLRLNATPLAVIAEVLDVSENEVVDRISVLFGAFDARLRRPREL